ncbi:MAG TPA: alanine racemase [Rhizomicrobium sp.]|nr:alanine racemase [Rhizomicrobium sp.]
MAEPNSIDTLPTPSLLLDRARLERNVLRMRERASALGISLRPHLKTAKSVDAARFVLGGAPGPATVSTLREADIFGKAGITDLLYAVSIAPQKLRKVSELRESGTDLKIILDSVEAAHLVAAHARRHQGDISVMIEVDVDGHRSGVRWDDHETLIAIARILNKDAKLHGILCHAGDSYHLHDPVALEDAASRERSRIAAAADALRAAGIACPVVSVGATPTALSSRSYEGVTELRAGVYMFFDMVQAGIGVCGVDDIALSVLATVIGHREDRDWIITDAGWMALSSDHGRGEHYGLVCDAKGQPFPDLVVLGTNQEHGIVGIRPGSSARLPQLAIGTRIRVLPNHACATAAQHDQYYLLDVNNHVTGTWPRFRGWD